MSDLWWKPLGVLLCVLAVTQIAWGWWRCAHARRQRTRRRCPRCWYDMSHTTGLTCSECGRIAKDEARLYRRRRRWLPLILALPIFAVAAVCPRVPDIRDDGWESAVPTTVLIAFLPQISADPRIRVVRPPGLSPFAAAPLDQAARLTKQLHRRCVDNQLWSWQWALLVERILADEPSRLVPPAQRSGRITCDYNTLMALAYQYDHLTRDQLRRADEASWVEFRLDRDWPLGAPVHGQTKMHHWQGTDIRYIVWNRETDSLVYDGRYRDPTAGSFVCGSLSRSKLWMDNLTQLVSSVPTSGALPFRVDMSAREEDNVWRPIRSYDIDVPVNAVDTIEECVSPIADASVDAALRKMPAPQLSPDRAGPDTAYLNLDLESIIHPLWDAGIGVFAVQLEVQDGERVLAAVTAWWSVPNHGRSGEAEARARISVRHQYCYFPITSPTDDLNCFRKPGLTLRITGDPITALRSRDLPTFWQGDVTIPLKSLEP